jgi:protein-S-isoprenylcysteine O-methyltransferase Ste14
MSVSGGRVEEESGVARLPRWMRNITIPLGIVIPLGVVALWWQQRRRLPRWMGLGMFLLAHDVLPWALSTLTRRRGWSERGPGIWNLLGLSLVAAGNALALWGFGLHLGESPRGLEWTESQRYFLSRGPYTMSRNPMYVGELALWLGWAVFHGSVAVFLGFGAWLMAFRYLIVPQEESALEERFGEAYLTYRAKVPRWLGIPRRRSRPAPDRQP